MKNKSISRLTAFLTCSLIASLSLTGCSQNGNESETAVKTTQTAEVTEAPSETKAAEETQAAEEIQETYELSKVSSFELSSESITDGVWNSIITNTAKGSNVSPQLSWEPVDSAAGYAVYMIDTSADNWLHWKSANVTVTTLEEGWAGEEEYIGPYPPGGTHTYVVYVLALKNSPSEIPGNFDRSNNNFMSSWDLMLSELNSAGGSSDNIISYGCISGTYTAGD